MAMQDIKINPPRQDGNTEGITRQRTIPGTDHVTELDELLTNENHSARQMNDVANDERQIAQKGRK